MLKAIGKAINDASVCGGSINEEVVEGIEGGIEGAATETRPDDDVRSETVDIELDVVLLISKPIEVKSKTTYDVRSEIIDIVLDAVVVASEPIEVISETTKIGVDAQVTAALSINTTVLFLPAVPLRSETTWVGVGKRMMAVLSVGLVVSFPLLSGWALKYES